MSIGLRAGVANDGYVQINGVDVVKVTMNGVTTPPVGQCRLNYISSTQVRLIPYNGNLLTIGGQNYPVPSSGVNLASTGLTLATNYYVYAYMNGTTMTLEAVTTTHATDATTGTEVKTGDSSRTLVGFIRTGGSSSPLFLSQNDYRWVLSWFNRRTLGLRASSGVSANWGGTSPVDLNSAYHANFLMWGDDTPICGLYGTVQNNTAGSWVGTQLSLNGSTVYGDVATVQPASSAGYPMNHAINTPIPGLSEGSYYVTMLVYIANGGTGTWNPFNVTAQIQG